MHEEPSFSIHSTEMDFITAIEADCRVPIAFEDRAAMDRWIDEDTELTHEPLGRRDDEDDVVMLRGLIKPPHLTKSDVGQGLFYKQVWASVRYERYLGAMKFSVKRFDGRCKSMHLYDADHAVSRNRLAKLWPNAWVNMIFVDRGVNRAVGAMLEKKLLEGPGPLDDPDRITINAESVLKTFYGPKSERMEFGRRREYLHRARQRFLQSKNQLVVHDAVTATEALRRMDEYQRSQHAWNFFDDFARSLGVELLVK